jgi:hypothetical protein
MTSHTLAATKKKLKSALQRVDAEPGDSLEDVVEITISEGIISPEHRNHAYEVAGKLAAKGEWPELEIDDLVINPCDSRENPHLPATTVTLSRFGFAKRSPRAAEDYELRFVRHGNSPDPAKDTFSILEVKDGVWEVLGQGDHSNALILLDTAIAAVEEREGEDLTEKPVYQSRWSPHARRSNPYPRVSRAGVITYNDAHPSGTPVAAANRKWSADAVRKKADAKKMYHASTWVEPGKEKDKSAYKFPHHYADGKNTLSPRGVAAAMAALMGARSERFGGPHFPGVSEEAARRGIYKHLAEHYRRDLKREPPALEGIPGREGLQERKRKRLNPREKGAQRAYKYKPVAPLHEYPTTATERWEEKQHQERAAAAARKPWEKGAHRAYKYKPVAPLHEYPITATGRWEEKQHQERAAGGARRRWGDALSQIDIYQGDTAATLAEFALSNNLIPLEDANGFYEYVRSLHPGFLEISIPGDRVNPRFHIPKGKVLSCYTSGGEPPEFVVELTEHFKPKHSFHVSRSYDYGKPKKTLFFDTLHSAKKYFYSSIDRAERNSGIRMRKVKRANPRYPVDPVYGYSGLGYAANQRMLEEDERELIERDAGRAERDLMSTEWLTKEEYPEFMDKRKRKRAKKDKFAELDIFNWALDNISLTRGDTVESVVEFALNEALIPPHLSSNFYHYVAQETSLPRDNPRKRLTLDEIEEIESEVDSEYEKDEPEQKFSFDGEREAFLEELIVASPSEDQVFAVMRLLNEGYSPKDAMKKAKIKAKRGKRKRAKPRSAMPKGKLISRYTSGGEPPEYVLELTEHLKPTHSWHVSRSDDYGKPQKTHFFDKYHNAKRYFVSSIDGAEQNRGIRMRRVEGIHIFMD